MQGRFSSFSRVTPPSPLVTVEITSYIVLEVTQTHIVYPNLKLPQRGSRGKHVLYPEGRNGRHNFTRLSRVWSC